MSHGAFSELALLLICALAGALFVRLRQPVLIAYIVVGIAAGPAVFGLVSAHDQIDLLAQVGVAVLLFAVGLKLDLHHIRHIGPVALGTGLGQLAFTSVIGFAIILALGKGWLEALYVAVALTFSSTIIIVKLLSDKRELDSLHGRIAVGFLIVQDLAVVIAMMVMSALRAADGAGAGASAWPEVLLSLAWRLAGAAALMFALMRWVLPAVAAAMARSQELLLVFAIAWGLALAALGEWAGFSKEAGAFLAGLTVAQISEFSIVFVAMGITLGHVGVPALGLTTLVGLITITCSTYMILYSHPLYERLAPWLGRFERKRPFRELAAERQPRDGRAVQAIVFGLGRYGSRLLGQLRQAGIETLGVDFDPEAVRTLRRHKLPVRFGDGEDPDLVESLPLEQAGWVVTTLPAWESNRALLHALQAAGYRGRVAAAPRDPAHARELARAGAARR
jgi:predicted Kef-type K+ transport protein